MKWVYNLVISQVVKCCAKSIHFDTKAYCKDQISFLTVVRNVFRVSPLKYKTRVGSQEAVKLLI